MPSRKRVQGKARMKAKAMAKTKKPTAVAEAATNRQQELSSLMQQIYIVQSWTCAMAGGYLREICIRITS
eukprot:scaffold22439_cov112-Skeletonema_marinoi.AAC.7